MSLRGAEQEVKKDIGGCRAYWCYSYRVRGSAWEKALQGSHYSCCKLAKASVTCCTGNLLQTQFLYCLCCALWRLSWKQGGEEGVETTGIPAGPRGLGAFPCDGWVRVLSNLLRQQTRSRLPHLYPFLVPVDLPFCRGFTLCVQYVLVCDNHGGIEVRSRFEIESMRSSLSHTFLSPLPNSSVQHCYFD